jgi:hypothetical protein
MRKLDAATIAAGTPSLELMERAGKQVANYLRARRDQIVPAAAARVLRSSCSPATETTAATASSLRGCSPTKRGTSP